MRWSHIDSLFFGAWSFGEVEKEATKVKKEAQKDLKEAKKRSVPGSAFTLSPTKQDIVRVLEL